MMVIMINMLIGDIDGFSLKLIDFTKIGLRIMHFVNFKMKIEEGACLHELLQTDFPIREIYVELVVHVQHLTIIGASL